ncbi:CoA-binding domain protein [Thermovirga lienii DSM 17291]|uniref:CoA-binding domain protein n=1 Tax=Thermovirga lienii (strain ATCC BAA-1197 / DSM 17291 / Cas60314) TaxID=580340 RepID=G7V6A0_THELD|nr:acetate--CoA ligase family protein [Thermovirga lienii]AER65929.1 CoA-binding domain protein [Thermovirga lienii DSM 17291]
MTQPIFNPSYGPMRVLGYASGSGATLFRALEMQKKLEQTDEGSPFQIVGLFSDNPDSKAVQLAKELNIPVKTLDIRQFYKEHNAPIKDREVRKLFDQKALELWEDLKPHLILLAGYVWATTEEILDALPVVNVHPADLSVQKDGKRAYAGADGVGDALRAGEKQLRSSSHLATSELDGGPILVISPPVDVIPAAEEMSFEDYRKYHLKLVNEQSRIVGARTVYEIAMGHFQLDSQGKVLYRGEYVPLGLRFESWDENKPLPERPLEPLYSPKSIAVIGASQKLGIGRAVLENIKTYGFKGDLFAVNRSKEDVSGAKGYKSVKEIPKELDLAMMCIPSSKVLDAVQECAEKGVKAIVGIAAGFKEVGEKGALSEKKLMEIVNRANMRFLGPNCMGLLNTDPKVKLHANILQGLPKEGGVAFVTQSGAIGAALLDYAEELGLGFSQIYSTGNQADININDLLPVLEKDESTKVVLCYMETLPEPARFRKNALSLTRKKPLIVIRSGKTEAGMIAAQSHTGSLAGDSAMIEAMIEQVGAITAKSLEEAFLLAAALESMPLPKGKRVGVISNAGGPGTLVADALAERGFALPFLPEDARARLAEKVLPEASTGNPIDLVATARPEHYALAAKEMVRSGLYDALVVIVVPPATVDTGEVARAMLPYIKEFNGPVLSCFFGPNLGRDGRMVFQKEGIPSFPFPEQTAEVLSKMAKMETSCFHHQAWPDAQRPSLSVRKDIRRTLGKNKGFLPPLQLRDLLNEYGIKTVPTWGLSEIGSLEGIYKEGTSYVLKVDHPEIIHKSESGGVVLGIKTLRELEESIGLMKKRLPGARDLLVQEMASGEMEIILGAVKKGSLGHAVMMGLGGVAVEVLKDTVLLPVPFSPAEAHIALRKLKAWRLISGYRGKKGADVEEIVQWLGSLARLVQDFPELSELDINPVIVTPEGLVAVDWRASWEF